MMKSYFAPDWSYALVPKCGFIRHSYWVSFFLNFTTINTCNTGNPCLRCYLFNRASYWNIAEPHEVTENNITDRIYASKTEIHEVFKRTKKKDIPYLNELYAAFDLYGKEYNITFRTRNSGEYAIKLVYRHYNVCRVTNEEPADIQGKDEEVIAKRKKNGQKIGCGCYIKAKPRKIGGWYIQSWETGPIPKARDI